MALSKKSNTGNDTSKKIIKKPVKKPDTKSKINPVVKEDKPIKEVPKEVIKETTTTDQSPKKTTSFLGSLLSKEKTAVVSLLKSIKPIYLFLGCIVLAVIIYFLLSKPDDYKQENKRLKNEINQIQKERDRISDSIKTLKYEYAKLEDSSKVKEKLLLEINQRITLIEQKVSTSFEELSKIKNGVNGLNAQIKSATENPVQRVGDDLIKSLKNKIN